jgi:hypothetical protein
MPKNIAILKILSLQAKVKTSEDIIDIKLNELVLLK